MDNGYQISDNATKLTPPAHVEWVHDARLATGDRIAIKPAHATAKNPELGAIAKMDVPNSWAYTNDSSDGHMVSFRPVSNKDVQFSSYEHGWHLSQRASEAFQKLLSEPMTVPKLLYSDSSPSANSDAANLFQSLAQALGSATVGDNQLTNSYKAPDPRSPIFHLDSARLETVNGKTVLAVDGWFAKKDTNGVQIGAASNPEKRRYSGIFFANKDKVQELFLSSDDNAAFVSNKAIFRSAIKSIEWK